MRNLFSIIAFSFYVGLSQNALPKFVSNDLENYISKGLTDYNLPGAGIVIVKEGKVVYNKGFGYANIKQKQAFSSDLIFPLASISKHIVASALINSIIEGDSLSLDAPILNFISKDSISNGDRFINTTLKNALSHKVGIEKGHGNFFLYETDFNNLEQVSKAWSTRRVKINKWGYNNASFRFVTHIIAFRNNKPFKQYIDEEFVKRYNIHPFLASYMAVDSTKRLSKYLDVDGINTELSYGPFDIGNYSGSISTSLNGMAKWMNFLLTHKKGQQILQQISQPIVKRGGSHPFNQTSHYYYGFGLYNRMYNGLKEYNHTGGVPGISTYMSLVPEKQLGIFIVINNSSKGAGYAFLNEILDSFLDLPFRDYSTLYHDGLMSQYKERYYNEPKKKKLKSLPTSINTDQLRGQYSHYLYGSIWFKVTPDGYLELSFEHHPNFKAYLSNKKEDFYIFSTTSVLFRQVEIKIIREGVILISFPHIDENYYVFKAKQK